MAVRKGSAHHFAETVWIEHFIAIGGNVLYRVSKCILLSSTLFLIGAIDAQSAEGEPAQFLAAKISSSQKQSLPHSESAQAEPASAGCAAQVPNECAVPASNQCSPPPIQCPPGWRVDLRGDFIYWYSNQSGMAYTNQAQSTFSTSNFSSGTLINPTYDWEPGVRVDAAYGFDHSYWYLGADVIWYRGKGSGSQTTTSTNGLFPVLSFANNSLSSDYANYAAINWTLYTTIFDILAYYDWIYNSYLTLTPSLGLRNVWLTEKATVHYQGGTYQAAPDIVNLRSNFYGIGPRLAFKPKFLLGRGFSFYAEGAGAVFGGWFDVTQSETFLSTTRAFLKRDVSGLRWGVDATSGLLYIYELNSQSNISFDLGFDFMWFNEQNEFVHGSQFTLPEQGASLMLYGGHAAFGFRF